MKFSPEDLLYLNGEKFSNSRPFVLTSYKNKVKNRVETVIEIVSGKKVLHVGCVDHVELIEKKRQAGKWLHERLLNSCEYVYGIDINAEGINYLKNNLSIEDVKHFDLLGNEDLNLNIKFDYIIVGEVLEHVDNPVDFLKRIKSKYQGIAEKIIVTIPNAFSKTICSFYSEGKELINTDHRYWFSPFTIAKVITKSDMEFEELYFADKYNNIIDKVYNVLNLPIMSVPAWQSDTIVAIAKL